MGGFGIRDRDRCRDSARGGPVFGFGAGARYHPPSLKTFMKKTLVLNVVLTACLIGGVVSARAEDNEKSDSKGPSAAQKPAPEKAPAAEKVDPAARSTSAQKDASAKAATEKREKSGSKGKVSINHKGRVISVSENAVKDHLAHGDTVVSEEAGSPRDGKSKEGGKGKDKDKNKDKGER